MLLEVKEGHNRGMNDRKRGNAST